MIEDEEAGRDQLQSYGEGKEQHQQGPECWERLLPFI